MKNKISKKALTSLIAKIVTIPLIVFILNFVLKATAVTCFKDSWPVKYAPIPMCTQAPNAVPNNTECWKYVVQDEDWGWYCQDSNDGARACDMEDTTITYDEYVGRCENGNCHILFKIYDNEPVDGTFGHERYCFGG